MFPYNLKWSTLSHYMLLMYLLYGKKLLLFKLSLGSCLNKTRKLKVDSLENGEDSAGGRSDGEETNSVTI